MILLFFICLLLYSSHCMNLCQICRCGKYIYNEEIMNVTNCTFSGFTFNNVTMLQNLPDETEVLIFRGNDIPVLPPNIFGSEKNFTNLKIIDMSDNKIEEVKGKTFHHAPSVERLILNHNSISFTSSHPRVFSNFENLRELHLNDAFLDYKSADLAEQLHTIFMNSNLKRLEKLHLEQNEIENFADSKVFCDLQNLLDLYLSNNKLRKLSFDIKCLLQLRYLDLKNNDIKHFTNEELATFDSFIVRNQSFFLDISKNPFICDCMLNGLYFWLQKTKVTVKNNVTIRCHYMKNHINYSIYIKDYNKSECNSKLSIYVSESDNYAHFFTQILLFFISFFLFIFLTILSIRYLLEYCKHSVIPVTKVHYVVIRNSDDREIHV